MTGRLPDRVHAMTTPTALDDALDDAHSDALDARAMIGTHDVLFVTLDTLRHDVACAALAAGRTPNLRAVLPGGAWQRRHTPGSFTYAAHQAFFAGFLPTPDTPGPHGRLFAAAFPGSETVTPRTCVFDAPEIVTGLRQRGYHTICIGGVGFFNGRSPLGSVLPGLFDESHWSPALGVNDPRSTENQVAIALGALARQPADRRMFLFLNVSAMHQPNCIFVEEATSDSVETQAAALAYVDSQLPPLFTALRRRSPLLCIICSDHGTTYGEDGFHGHRLSHPVVWTVPYAEFVLSRSGGTDLQVCAKRSAQSLSRSGGLDHQSAAPPGDGTGETPVPPIGAETSFDVHQSKST
jgi:hypothetical protein